LPLKYNKTGSFSIGFQHTAPLYFFRIAEKILQIQFIITYYSEIFMTHTEKLL